MCPGEAVPKNELYMLPCYHVICWVSTACKLLYEYHVVMYVEYLCRQNFVQLVFCTVPIAMVECKYTIARRRVAIARYTTAMQYVLYVPRKHTVSCPEESPFANFSFTVY